MVELVEPAVIAQPVPVTVHAHLVTAPGPLLDADNVFPVRPQTGNVLGAFSVIVLATVQVTVRDTGTAGFPQLSETFHVLVSERLHPLVIILPSDGVGVPTPQLSVAVAVPNAASMAADIGPHPRVKVVPLA